MKKIAFATAALAALAFTAPAFAQGVSVRIGEGDHHRGHMERHMERHDVRMHRDHWRHEGWRHHDRHHGKKVVIIKKIRR